VNTSDAAAALGKTAWWIRRQCKAGELRASYFGGSWLIPPEAIDEFLEAHSNAPRTVAARRRPRRA
jgi:excisionase family DNA binding protein